MWIPGPRNDKRDLTFRSKLKFKIEENKESIASRDVMEKKEELL